MPKLENTTESIELLTKIMTEKGVSKLSYSCEEFEIKLETPAANQTVFSVPQTAAMPVQAAAQAIAPTPAAEKKCGNIVKSPIVGTYYNAPAPDKDPFVKVGQKIKKGDVLMIIESMKLMNEIQSECDGTIAEIMVENGTGVEFDQPIMRVE
ncbi:MAG TPA: acetyl-CoA carboxylase biotin carboxyl carrier protein [Oscillospiraceae bacterium]|nr:acetyl-CoA carboxylase biotin carboxyl carrier protein [Oscillospiraceae bacterium]